MNEHQLDLFENASLDDFLDDSFYSNNDHELDDGDFELTGECYA